MTARTGQKLNEHLLSVQMTILSTSKKMFGASEVYGNFLPSKFVNMDETAVIFEAKPKSAVGLREAETVSMR